MNVRTRHLAKISLVALLAGASRLVAGCGSDTADASANDATAGTPDDADHAGDDGTGATTDDAGSVTPTPHGFCLQPGNGDYTQPGPYAVATKSVDLASTGALPEDAGATTYELFYPENMDDGCPHPFVAWGNGLGIPGSYPHAFMNRNLASWGLVVIASDNPVVVHGVSAPYHTAAIDYMLAQNQDPSSLFYGKLSTRAGTAGCSLGGAGATLASAHPNVEATMLLESAGFPKPGIAFLVLCGTNDTVVGTGPPTDAYDRATGPSLLGIYEGADHTETPSVLGWEKKNPGTIQYVRFYTAWFRCFLGDDPTACAMFKGGKDCGVCGDPNWAKLVTKNM